MENLTMVCTVKIFRDRKYYFSPKVQLISHQNIYFGPSRAQQKGIFKIKKVQIMELFMHKIVLTFLYSLVKILEVKEGATLSTVNIAINGLHRL